MSKPVYLEVDNVQPGPFACWSVHAPQTGIFLQHLEVQEGEDTRVKRMLHEKNKHFRVKCLSTCQLLCYVTDDIHQINILE